MSQERERPSWLNLVSLQLVEFNVAYLTTAVADHLRRPLLRIGSLEEDLSGFNLGFGIELKEKINNATEWGGLVLFDGTYESEAFLDRNRTEEYL